MKSLGHPLGFIFLVYSNNKRAFPLETEERPAVINTQYTYEIDVHKTPRRFQWKHSVTILVAEFFSGGYLFASFFISSKNNTAKKEVQRKLYQMVISGSVSWIINLPMIQPSTME